MLDVTAYSAGKDVTSQNFTVTLKEKANDSIFKFVIVNSKTGEPLDEYQYYGLNP